MKKQKQGSAPALNGCDYFFHTNKISIFMLLQNRKKNKIFHQTY